VERERRGAQAHPVGVGHHRGSVTAADTSSSSSTSLGDRAQAGIQEKYAAGEQGQRRASWRSERRETGGERVYVCMGGGSPVPVLCSPLQPRWGGRARESTGAQLQLQSGGVGGGRSEREGKEY
jgi:hypothetical protein